MFLSKIWLFVITILAAVALVIALVLPRPAQRTRAQTEQQRLVLACSVVDILLADNARNRVEIAASFARDQDIVNTLTAASEAKEIDDARAKAAGDLAKAVREKIGVAGSADAGKAKSDEVKPDFVILLDRTGRVVARFGGDKAGDFGDTLAGRAIVDDALAGYLRDDLWADKNGMFLVSASPVVKRDPPVAYEGAVVLGHAVSTNLAKTLVKALDVDIGFYIGGDAVASTSEAVFAKDTLASAVPKGASIAEDCKASAQTPLELKSGDKTYSAVLARLPGEASHQGAFYSVYVEKPAAVGFSGTLGAVKQNDLGFGSFPWLLVGALLVLALAAGMFLMIWEVDRPLRRLNADAVRLAKSEAERLAEEEHHGKFGSIARSVNIQIDKLHRDAKSARKDLDQLLGPAPEGSLGAMDLVAATALPAARPGLPLGMPAPSAPPPPSEFRFGDPAPAPSSSGAPRAAAGPAPALDLGPPPSPVAARPSAPPARPTPPPKPAVKPPIPTAAPAARPRAVEDDILGAIEDPSDPTSVGAEPNSPAEDQYFHTVFDQFVDMKKKCGETITGLTFAKFAEKLRKNRDELMSKTVCKSVKFTVYV
ncbi:MAG TPA: MXAN_5187 family protein, partial [Kofleriaceae bacterium]|nr:MXAN_5187 family protein [Kofleriaceae bacterium]